MSCEDFSVCSMLHQKAPFSIPIEGDSPRFGLPLRPYGGPLSRARCRASNSASFLVPPPNLLRCNRPGRRAVAHSPRIFGQFWNQRSVIIACYWTRRKSQATRKLNLVSVPCTAAASGAPACKKSGFATAIPERVPQTSSKLNREDSSLGESRCPRLLASGFRRPESRSAWASPFV